MAENSALGHPCDASWMLCLWSGQVRGARTEARGARCCGPDATASLWLRSHASKLLDRQALRRGDRVDDFGSDWRRGRHRQHQDSDGPARRQGQQQPTWLGRVSSFSFPSQIPQAPPICKCHTLGGRVVIIGSSEVASSTVSGSSSVDGMPTPDSLGELKFGGSKEETWGWRSSR